MYLRCGHTDACPEHPGKNTKQTPGCQRNSEHQDDAPRAESQTDDYLLWPCCLRQWHGKAAKSGQGIKQEKGQTTSKLAQTSPTGHSRTSLSPQEWLKIAQCGYGQLTHNNNNNNNNSNNNVSIHIYIYVCVCIVTQLLHKSLPHYSLFSSTFLSNYTCFVFLFFSLDSMVTMCFIGILEAGGLEGVKADGWLSHKQVGNSWSWVDQISRCVT